MPVFLLIPVALIMWGCSADPLPTEAPTDTVAPAPLAADKVALPPMPGEASLEFWDAMDAFMAEGRSYLPNDFENDENDRGRTFLDYLPRDHPWFDNTDRFRYESGSSHGNVYTLRENLDPDDDYGNSLFLTVRAGIGRRWDSPYTPPGWDSYYGTRGELNARYKQTAHKVLKILRTMHRFRASTTVFFGYPTQEADIFMAYPNDRGRTFSDLFPGPLPFANAYTGLVKEPGWEGYAVALGEVYVMSLTDEYGFTDGFSITARGYSLSEYMEVRYRSAIIDHPWVDGRGGPREQDVLTDEPRTH